jgi:hypothetical protein
MVATTSVQLCTTLRLEREREGAMSQNWVWLLSLALQRECGTWVSERA